MNRNNLSLIGGNSKDGIPERANRVLNSYNDVLNMAATTHPWRDFLDYSCHENVDEIFADALERQACQTPDFNG